MYYLKQKTAGGAGTVAATMHIPISRKQKYGIESISKATVLPQSHRLPVVCREDGVVWAGLDWFKLVIKEGSRKKEHLFTSPQIGRSVHSR